MGVVSSVVEDDNAVVHFNSGRVGFELTVTTSAPRSGTLVVTVEAVTNYPTVDPTCS